MATPRPTTGTTALVQWRFARDPSLARPAAAPLLLLADGAPPPPSPAAQAIYFGNAHWGGNTGAGATGPWVGADLESGMYYGGGSQTRINNQSQPLAFDFVSLTLKGRTDGFLLKGGDATKGEQTVMYNGSRPFEPDTTPPARLQGGERGTGTAISLRDCAVGDTGKKQLWTSKDYQWSGKEQTSKD